MKYLLTFNESVFDGDFLYKEIEAHEFRNLEDDKEGVVPNEDTLDKIYDLFKGKVDDDIDKSLIDANSGFIILPEILLFYLQYYMKMEKTIFI